MAEEKSEKLRLCPLCKSFVKEGTEICPRCGANLSSVPEEPPKDADKMPFGKEMKTALFMCPECGAFLSEDAKKCPVCNVEIEPEKDEEEEKKIAEEISKELDIDEKEEVPKDTFKCPLCSTVLGKDTTKCSKCGSEFIMKKTRAVKRKTEEPLEEPEAPVVEKEPEPLAAKPAPKPERKPISKPKTKPEPKAEEVELKKPAVIPSKPKIRSTRVSIKQDRKFEFLLAAAVVTLVVHYVWIQASLPSITYTTLILYGALFIIGLGLVFSIKTLKFMPKGVFALLAGFAICWIIVLSWNFIGPSVMLTAILGVGAIVALVGLAILEGWRNKLETTHLVLTSSTLLLFLASIYTFFNPSEIYNLNIIIGEMIGGSFIVLSFGLLLYRKIAFPVELPALDISSDEKIKSLKDKYPKKAFGNDVPWYSKASALILLEKYEEALECADIALKINPKNEVAWVVKGNAFSKMGEYMEALKAFNAAIKLNPRYEVAWNNKGNALSRLKKYEDALRCYEEAIKIIPDYREAWVNKGYVLAKLGKYKDAAQCAEKVTSITPKAKASSRA